MPQINSNLSITPLQRNVNGSFPKSENTDANLLVMFEDTQLKSTVTLWNPFFRVVENDFIEELLLLL